VVRRALFLKVPSNMTATSTAVPRVLIVDDTPEDRLLAGAVVTNVLAWQASYADDGVAALEALQKERPQVVLTDLQMPKMNGLRLVTEIRKKFPGVPVVLMTAHGSEEIALKALQAGAASYVPKRSLDADLADTLERVLSTIREQERLQAVLAQIAHAELQFQLANDRYLVSAVIQHLQTYLEGLAIGDKTARTQIGVALEEALLNAMYHGNLELSSDLRQNGEEPFYRLAEERIAQAPYRDRKVALSVTFTPDLVTFVIRDQGPGFNPGALPDPTDPENMDRIGGRGLLLIRTFMDDVRFTDKGNEITLLKRRHAAGHDSP
jgi:CheY-like chemotaxis protein